MTSPIPWRALIATTRTRCNCESRGPHSLNGIRALKEYQGIKDYDVNKMGTRQEMCAYVCAPCHVEYYFKWPEKLLTYPWHDGNKADEILA